MAPIGGSRNAAHTTTRTMLKVRGVRRVGEDEAVSQPADGQEGDRPRLPSAAGGPTVERLGVRESSYAPSPR